jgi:hypothetical protein
MPTVIVALALVATALDGLLAGASLDQSIKQLPARYRMGVVAFSAYSQAADLGNGIVWYAALGVGAAMVTISAAIGAWVTVAPAAGALPLWIAAGLSVLHSLVTARAAPTNFSQRKVANDAVALAGVFDRFARWQALRAAVQVLTFGTMLWALVALYT